ncbi:hypothetical protein ABPG74_012081 [Tetrahymena malaccensis]
MEFLNLNEFQLPQKKPLNQIYKNYNSIEKKQQDSAWSIQPPSSSSFIASSNIPCQSVIRIDDQRFAGGLNKLEIYSLQGNQINILNSTSFSKVSYFQRLSDQYVLASSSQYMRIYNVNDLSQSQSFDCISCSTGLFYNQYDNVMISSCSLSITIWNKLNMNNNSQYTSVTTQSSPSNISIIQPLTPLNQMTFLASSTSDQKVTIYILKYQNSQIITLKSQNFSNKATFKSLGQIFAVYDQQSLTFYDSTFTYVGQINQQLLGFDYLKFQNQLILYDNQNKVYTYSATFDFQQCTLPCQTCLDNDFSQCLSCNPNTLVVNSNFQCTCKDNQYLDTNNSCQNCDQSCKTCSNSSTCKTCNQGKVIYQNLCQDKCPDGYFQDSTNKCQQCPNNCAKCDQSGNCSKCQDNFYLNSNNTCQSSCTDKYYPDNNNVCQLCLQNCSKCTSSSQCTKCITNYNLFQNQQCLATCPDKYYADNDNICQQCMSNCSQCNSSTQCSKCSPNYVLSKNFQCISACSDQYYLDNNGVCQQCITNCSQCSSSGNCDKCLPGYYLYQNSKCLKACPYQYYPDNDNICQPCLQNCALCTSQTSCNKCLPNYFLLQNSQCLLTCPDQYYQDNGQSKCQQCSTSYCKSCDSNNNCSQCQNNYFLKEKQCVQSCGPGYQQSNNLCSACKAYNCQECKNQIDQCSSCLANFDNYNNQCIPSCSKDQIRDKNGNCIDNIQFSLISKNNNQILVIFKIKPNLDNIQKNMKIEIPQLQQQFDYKITVQDEYSIVITISPNQKINENLKVTIAINNQFGQQQDTQQSISIQIQGQEQDKNPSVTQSLETATQVVSTATITAIFPLMLSGNFWMISSILDISQIIYMTSFIDFKISSSLDTFLSSQKNFKIPFPNFFEYIDHYEEIEYKTPDKISEKNIQGFYLSNMGDTISLMIIIFAVKITFRILYYSFYFFEGVKNSVSKIEGKLFPFSLLIDLVWVVYQDMSFSVILQFNTLNIAKYGIEIINYFMFSIGFIGIGIPLLFAILIYKNTSEKLKEHLTKDLNFEYYQISLYVRKLYYTIIVGAIQVSPLSQIILLIVFHLIQLLLIYKIKPFKKSFFNVKDGLHSFFFLISHILVLVLYVLDQDQESSIQIICWIILSSFSLIIILEVFQCFKEIYSEAKKYYFKLKRMKKKQLTIVPHSEQKFKEDDQNLEIKRSSCEIKDIQSAIQQQNAYNDQSPTKLDDQSPTKLDSKQLISFMAEQSAFRFELDSPHKRILRSAKRLQEQEIQSQVRNSQRQGTLLRVSQSQYEIQNEPQSAQESKIIQTNRSSSALILEDSKIVYNNFINGEKQKSIEKKQILKKKQSTQVELNDEQQFGIYNQQSCTNL